MTQTLTAPQTTDEGEPLSHTQTLEGQQPVTDIEAFFARLPRFTDAEVNELEEAVLQDRAQRRAAVGVAI